MFIDFSFFLPEQEPQNFESASVVKPGDRAECFRLELLEHHPLRLERSSAAPAAILLALQLPERAAVSIAVYDAGQRRVRLLAATLLEQGCHAVEWEGCNDFGQPLPAGGYVVEVEAAGEGGQCYLVRRQVSLVSAT